MPYEQPSIHLRADVPTRDGVLATPADTEPAADTATLDILEESPPEHGWLGNGFVWAMYALVPLSLLSAVFLLSGGWEIGTVAGMLPMVLFFPLLYLWLARSVQTFKLQGWGVAMLALLLSLVASVRVLLGNPDGIQILAAFATMALEIAWIRYFWMRRPDFT